MAGTMDGNSGATPIGEPAGVNVDATTTMTPVTSAASDGVPAGVESTSVTGDATAQEAAQAAHQPTEDNDDDESEEVVTLHEVLQEQAELNEAADAVLGDCSDDNCSYEMGYYRQALYACLTCTPATSPFNPDTAAGVCLACSYHCHTDHELIELYTKREFRCDCGNSRFPSANPCTLFADKTAVNERNTYSQNFAGIYCECHRPYPDPERTTPEIMVQCIVCEDWLHEEHIVPSSEATSPSSVAVSRLPHGFDELICLSCVKKHEFLLAYQILEKNHEHEPVETFEESKAASCRLEQLQLQFEAAPEAERKLRPTFWSVEWRSRLCSCSKCVARFEKEHIAFLMDTEDSLQAYEARAHGPQLSQEEPAPTSARESHNVVSSTVELAMSSLEAAAERAFQAKLSHEQQVEMAVGYNHMKQKLQTYLATFAANGKTVRAEDIQGFFAELQESKRQRLS